MRQSRTHVRRSDSNNRAIAHRGIAALLSQALVAYTIEFDNEFERRMSEAGYPAAYLSLVIWFDLLRFIPEAGVSVRELMGQVTATPERLRFQLGCLERWNFIHFLAEPGKDIPVARHRRSGRELRAGFGSGRGIRGEWKVLPTTMGQQAIAIWPTLFDEIEGRWEARFGKSQLKRLRECLEKITADGKEKLPIGRLLLNALREFTKEFDRESAVPLALCANAIRILGPEAIPESEIPRRTGSSPETSGIGWQLKPYITIETDPARGRGKFVRLNEKALAAQTKYHRLIGEIESRWEGKCGKDRVRQLRESLLALFTDPAGRPPRIAGGMIPPPGVLRADTQVPALGRRDIGSAARQRRRDCVKQTQSFIHDPAGALPHYPLWDMNRGFGP